MNTAKTSLRDLGLGLFSAVKELAAPAASAAQDETYVFDVAVNVTNLAPEVQAIGASCSVCDAYQCDRRARNAVGGENAHYFGVDETRSFTGTIWVGVKTPTLCTRVGYLRT